VKAQKNMKQHKLEALWHKVYYHIRGALSAGKNPEPAFLAALQMKDSVAAALILGNFFDNPSASAFVKPMQWRQRAPQQRKRPPGP
jgi:hypothetical protein